MNDTATIRALLELEDAAPDELFERVPGTDAHFWPLARWPIAAALSSQNLNVTPVPARLPSGFEHLRLRIGRQLPNPYSSDKINHTIENLFIVSGTTKAPTRSRTGNWLTDDFAMSLEDRAMVVQDAPLTSLTKLSDRPVNRRTRTFDAALLRVRYGTQIEPLPQTVREQTERILKVVFDHLGSLLSESTRKDLTVKILRRLHRLPHAEREYIDLLDRTEPNRIFMQTAAYGDRSNFIRLAHERNISVVELQHGWIGASHSAYNFGAAMTDTVLTKDLPDTFYTFGEYWGKHLRFPGKVVPVGKPVLEKSARLAAPYHRRQKRLLLVSSVYERERLLASARSLRSALPPDWQIALRPHPSERANAAEFFADALAAGVVLDEASEVSTSIAASRAVVGMISTVLYEALPLGVHLGVIETELASQYSDNTLFPLRMNETSGFDEFVSLLTRDEAPDPATTEFVWTPNAVENFKRLTTAADNTP